MLLHLQHHAPARRAVHIEKLVAGVRSELAALQVHEQLHAVAGPLSQGHEHGFCPSSPDVIVAHHQVVERPTSANAGVEERGACDLVSSTSGGSSGCNVACTS